MKFYKFFIINFFLLFSFLYFTQTAQAGIVPCGLTSNYADKCTLCHLFTGIENIIDWGMKILVVVALVAIVAGGIMYIISAGNTSMMESAKNVIKQALWGVVIVLGAWLIVNTAMFLLATKADLGIGVTGWSDFDCMGSATGSVTVSGMAPVGGVCDSGYHLTVAGTWCLPDGTTITPTTPTTPGLPTTPTTPAASTCTNFSYSAWTPEPCTAGSTQTRTATGSPAGCTGGTPGLTSRTCPDAAATATEASVRSKLADAGITINNSSCCFGTGCTCVGGMREETVDGIIDFKKRCDAEMAAIGGGSCDVVISGGNEDGVHSEVTEFNHVNGYKVDIRMTPTVTSYIKTYFTEIPEKRSDGSTGYRDEETGAVYYIENNHVDVLYNSQG